MSGGGAGLTASGHRPPTGGHTTTCATCHVVATDCATFSCLTGGCHPQATTTSRHGDVGSFRYESSACHSCHPRGSAGD